LSVGIRLYFVLDSDATLRAIFIGVVAVFSEERHAAGTNEVFARLAIPEVRLVGRPST
jgi:hypothetical protein